MEKPKTYCEFVGHEDESSVHRLYHDLEYGFPIEDDDLLFERLVLEINQAGLSWTTILNKKKNFRKAYHHFHIKKVASYSEKDIHRLLADSGIIRNHLKIQAAIHNAKQIISIQKEFGSFKNWLYKHHPLSKEEWVRVFKKTFKFTGPEIVNEFLMSTGFLPNAHIPTCPIYKKIIKLSPPWLNS